MHKYELKVFHADTDCYKVVWHGTYLRFLEQARCAFATENNRSLKSLEENNIFMPVVNIELKYMHPAKLYDELIIETSLFELGRIRLVFLQKIFNKNTNEQILEAKVTCTPIDENGKLYRKMPKELSEIFKN